MENDADMIGFIKLLPFILGPICGFLLARFHYSMKDKSTGAKVGIGILVSLGAFFLLQELAHMLILNIELGVYE